MRTNRRSVLSALALAPLSSSLIVGCKKKQKDTIVVGAYLSMTGSEAEFGISTRNGVQLAVDELNTRGGVLGKRFRLVVEDDRGDSTEAASAVTRLIDREGAEVIIGEVASSLSLSGGRVAQRRRIPMVSPSSTNEDVTRVGDYIFRVCFIDPFQGSVMARFAKELQINGQAVQKVAIFRDEASAYSTGLARAFRETFARLGGELVDEQSYHKGDTHFSAQLSGMLAKQPQAIFVPGYYTEVTLIAREARALGYTGPFLGGDGWDSPALFRNDENKLVGSYFSEGFAPDHPTSPVGEAFVRNYRQRFGHDANGLAALGYDAMLVAADAIRRAGQTDGPAVRAALAATQRFEGATGRISIDAQRNAIKSAVILEVREDAFRFHRAIEAT
ncbi:MAG: ABC transporter substrate-binding protein [Deltaproteobacteria bacterium]|nr:ABC transporter substrate-binding protein [Deltaproteobacteria bacterium]